ncbi:MAG: cyclic nucleotide-binding domain-containing protein [Vicinamibacteria bacterium]|nr:cyclic nucleotide-binding domain-containing protein [Vicinamibacteria bacterium]
MVLSWFGGAAPKGVSVDDLIAKKKYGQAVELLLEQFKQGARDARLRMQLADVMVLSGKGKEAVPILQGLADEYAAEGFAAKAIAVLKKIEKIQPGRADVANKLASQVEKKKSDAPSTQSFRAPAMPEFGMEEIGMEAEPVAAPVAAAPTPAPQPRPTPAPPPAVPDDLLAIPVLEPEPAAASEMGDGFLEDSLLGVIQEALAAPSSQAPAPQREFVASPLFSEFSQDELVAVIEGLELIAFDAGDIVISQGEPGNSVFILTTGMVKAFVRDQNGRNVKVREMAEGAFFGEISILTGAPRTATVTAASPCEMLVLDRPTLDRICADKPRVMEVLQEFHRQRTAS